jgi:sporulation protein YlmC with PRC-barrel domain
MTKGKVSLAVSGVLALALALPAYAAVENQESSVVPPDMTGGKIPPKEHKLAPAVPEGNFKIADQHEFLHKQVKNRQGQDIGTIDKIIVDSSTGRVAYAEVALKETNQMVPIPWSFFNMQDGAAILNASKEQLEQAGSNFPAMNPADFEHKGAEPLKPHHREGGG